MHYRWHACLCHTKLTATVPSDVLKLKQKQRRREKQNKAVAYVSPFPTCFLFGLVPVSQASFSEELVAALQSLALKRPRLVCLQIYNVAYIAAHESQHCRVERVQARKIDLGLSSTMPFGLLPKVI